MTIWGKLIGSTSGFALGGPLGGLIGALAGHAIDKIKKQKLPEKIVVKQIGFTIGVIALSAKMAKADGKVTKEEVIAFRKHIIIPNKEVNNVRKIWNQAKKSINGFEIYASQLSKLFEPKSIVLQQLIHLLFNIAASDGKVNNEELLYLYEVSKIFGFTKNDFDKIKSYYLHNNYDPYKILDVKKNTPLKIINQKRLKLIKQNHPDKLIAAGLPKEFIEKSTKEIQIINKAWEDIKNFNK